jgi:PAS domain S-box-containing protein
VIESLRDFFTGGGGFMPHGSCYLWNPGLIRLHVISDGLIALSYTSIPFTLAYFVRKRKDLPFSWMFLAFGLFIISCGATHYMEIWTLWTPAYWLSGAVKAVTAAASVTTAVLLVRLMPQALALPRPGKIHEVEDRFRRLLEAAPDAMVIVDAKGSILLMNAQAESLFGYRRSELVGQKIEVLVPRRYREEHPGHREDYAHDPRTRPMGAGLDLWSVRKDGVEFPVEISLSPMSTDEGPWTIAAIRDVSDRRRAAETLKAYAAQLERSNRELRDVSYSVAHDLRAPARSVVTFSEHILKKSGELDGETRGLFDRVVQAGKRLLLMLDGLLELSQLSQKEPAREPVELSSLIRQRLDELAAQEPERRFELSILEDMPARGDPRLIGILIQNLVENAWKFTRDRATTRIEAGKLVSEGEISYFIRDNGRGFDPELANQLFRPFHRLPNAGDVAGVGIGLASSARVVEAHGGKIWAEGRSGRGATFFFSLGERA